MTGTIIAAVCILQTGAILQPAPTPWVVITPKPIDLSQPSMRNWHGTVPEEGIRDLGLRIVELEDLTLAFDPALFWIDELEHAELAASLFAHSGTPIALGELEGRTQDAVRREMLKMFSRFDPDSPVFSPGLKVNGRTRASVTLQAGGKEVRVDFVHGTAGQDLYTDLAGRERIDPAHARLLAAATSEANTRRSPSANVQVFPFQSSASSALLAARGLQHLSRYVSEMDIRVRSALSRGDEQALEAMFGANAESVRPGQPAIGMSEKLESAALSQLRGSWERYGFSSPQEAEAWLAGATVSQVVLRSDIEFMVHAHGRYSIQIGPKRRRP